MPITPTYPGVYIEEVPSGVRTITPVATSITAFIGSATRGPTDRPELVNSFPEFERKFGEIEFDRGLGYAVQHFFAHGGGDALIVRVVAENATKAVGDANGLSLEAASAGEWGDGLRIRIDHNTSDRESSAPKLFNLFLYDPKSRTDEEFRNLSFEPGDKRYVKDVLEGESAFARVPTGKAPTSRPGKNPDPEKSPWFDDEKAFSKMAGGGSEGSRVTGADLVTYLRSKNTLEKSELFNILCIPPLRMGDDVFDLPEVYKEALIYCKKRRAILLVDPPSSWKSADQAAKAIDGRRSSDFGGEDVTRNAAVYFPRLKMADPKKENRTNEFVPCGAIAGIMARTDAERGVWKSPAGTEAGLRGVREFSVLLNDNENGRINVKGVNALRTFRAFGHVVWGARTLAGSDELGSEWKYLAVRRFALFLEESLYRGTQWVVFEPNDEPLWSQIRLNIGTFMNDLFRQGAFQGRSPREAYFVKCDKDTTTQSDINRGIVNIEVGFAPLRPAEFVIIKIQQINNLKPQE